jgi:hypothetical protein
MRYKAGEAIPKEHLASHASDDMLMLTAILGVLIGIAITVIGRKGKQMWMWVWGIGLVLVSLYMGFSMATGLKLFTHF